MKSLLFLLLVLILQDVPYKPNEEFEVTLDYQYKVYKEKERKTVDYSEHRPTGSSLLFLVTRVKLKTLSSEEVRVQVSSNMYSLMVNKKAEPNMVLKLEFGFIEDVKDRATAHEYTILLVSPDKKKVSRIYLFIEEDGTFLVNGQKRGKF